MNIGEVAKRTGLTSKSIRLYEEKGLIHSLRSENGYRTYSDVQIQQLVLIARAKNLGFSLDDCKELVELSQNNQMQSAVVKAKTVAKIADIEQKIADLTAIKNTLKTWASHCPGNESNDCPIMDGLKEGWSQGAID
ncbi:Cu(I)-responsive transcriptional regulator [Vibrio hippocampi]|uniref:HTH-type transcriptional regulator CueR n=1 Tax=Vibrio hippocampi TaxID=654686 RepID=A0ABM8ZF88_9VIBR|nr:Cu(I)-responsive transcriptional regulator [Vibrio hippocampi]CAH0525092.1 HTH-type transcriptional regulator CueR [Vibrio hippocampi]